MTKKTFYPKRPTGLPKGYDSWDEYDLHKGILKNELFHPPRVQYISKHTYQPDFQIDRPSENKTYLIEFKGYFRDSKEAAKYTWIEQALDSNTQLLFVFSKIDKPIHFKAKRKACGTKMTHGQWAEKNGFDYYDVDSFTIWYNNLNKQ